MKARLIWTLAAGVYFAQFLPTDALAQFDFGGYTFPDRSAFADEASEVGSPPPGKALLPHGTTSVNTALTDVNLNTWVIAGGSAGMADVRFTDNVIVNESGPDFVVFEYSVPDYYRIAVSRDGTTANLTAFREYSGTQAIDLSDFGIPAGATVSLLRIQPNVYEGPGAGELSGDIQDIGALHSQTPAVAYEKFDFNDGTVQGWTLAGAFDENAHGPFSSNFFNGWQDAVNYPCVGLDQMGDRKGSLRMATLGGHGITNPGATWWIMQLHSPDLAGSPTWQSAKGYTVEIAECMASFGSIYANLFVKVYDQDQARDRTFYSGAAQALTHGVYGDPNAQWNHLTFDWSTISSFPSHYTVKEIFINLWGHMDGTYYEGGVYVDEVTPLVEEGPQPPTAPSDLQAYQTMPQIHITWQDNSNDETGFRLEYMDSVSVVSPWQTLAELGPNVTSYQMDNPVLGHTYLFRVAAVKDGILSAYSNTARLTYRLYFGYLRVDSPNGGEVWPVGTTQTISWTAYMIPMGNYALEYSIDGGSNWQTIAPLIPPSSSYSWTVPNTPSTNCIVKVRLASYNIYDLTDHPFTITTEQVPVLSVTPSARDVPASAGTTTFDVVNLGGGTMNWTAAVTEGSSWLSITSGASGTNSGTIEVSYGENSSTSSRIGTITVTAPAASGSPAQVAVSQSGREAAAVTASIHPASKQIYLNRTGSVDVVVEGVTNMGSFQFEIGFTGAVVNIANASDVLLGPFLGSTGGTVIPVGPDIDNTAGTVVYGAATFGAQAGPNGSGVLATITWTGGGEGTTALDLRNVQVSDVNGVVVPVNEVDGEIVVRKGFWADVNDDGRVDIIDIQLVCAHWNTHLGEANYDPRFDVDNEGQGDGDIDIIDIQLVASWWNRPLPSAGLARASAAPPPPVRLTMRPVTDESGPLWELIAEGAADLAGFQFDLVSSEAVLVSAFEVGEFLHQGQNIVTPLDPQATDAGRRVTLGAFSYGASAGATGCGTLARLRVRGDGSIRVENVVLADRQGQLIPVSGIVHEATRRAPLPRTLSLQQNYPNPFNPETAIRFELPGEEDKTAHVSMRVLDVKGHVVRTLLDEQKVPGVYTVIWDGCDQEGRPVPSGVYFYTLTGEQQRLTAKMVLMR